jgi:hypothetical protein
MEADSVFPASVFVRATPPVEGLAVSLSFEMRRKNSFTYTVFLDSRGAAEISDRDLLTTFDEDVRTFLMDYVDPRSHFTGRITATVMSDRELQQAVEAFEMFRGHLSFPARYESRLRAALARGQKPDDFQLKVETKLPSGGH